MVFRFRPERSAPGLCWLQSYRRFSQPALAASRDVEVLIDQATMLRLERPAAEIVVGNPSIADVSVQSGKVLVLTGKSFGETNLIVLDAEGKVIINRRVVVQEPRTGFVTVYRGTNRETLHCSPNCETPLVIGDNPDYFEVHRQRDQDQAGDRSVLGRRREAERVAAGAMLAAPRLAINRQLFPYCAMRSSLRPCAMSWKIAASCSLDGEL